MQDAIMKGNGNSRYLKSVASFLSLYPTYEDFAQALMAGTLPIDLNGVNSAGWSQEGTPLNKASLLKDTTAALYGLTASAVPDEALAAIKPLIEAANANADSRIIAQIGTYTGDGGGKRTLTFSGKPMFVYITEKAQSSKKYEFSLVYGMTEARACTSTTVEISLTWGDTSVAWTVSTNSLAYGLNVSKTAYTYIALLGK